jgi:alpha-beta hydrolase superfamily lysophospholipase
MDATKKHLLSRNGANLAVYDWPHIQQKKPRAAVLIVHALGDYGLRYQRLAQRLMLWGCTVRSFDFYGHGASEGAKGMILHTNQLAEDVADVAQDWQSSLPADTPLITLGYSSGATAAAQAQLQGLMHADAHVMISPMLRIQMNWLQYLGLMLFRYLLPDRVGPAHFTPLMHTSEPNEQVLLGNDPQWVRVISVRLGDTMFNMAAEVLRRAKEWESKTLLLYNATRPPEGGVEISGTEDFVLGAARAHIESKKYEGVRPDLLHESNTAQVYVRLQQWLDRYFAPQA